MNKHLLLTGGAGFIGSHVVEHVLKNTDWNITILDRLTYAGNLNRLVDIDCWEREKGRVRFIFHDFRAPVNRAITHGIKAIFGPVDYLIHMGAESHVDRSIDDPLPFAESNVIGTVNILNYAKFEGIPRIIYVSTDEVYGPSINGHLHVEGEPHKPGNPYSASKAAAEDFCLAYANTYGLPVIITNTMNNFGERQDVEKFVPKTLRAILKREPVVIHVKKAISTTVEYNAPRPPKITGPQNIIDISSRCWLHARNHADALLFLLQRKTFEPGERYNVTGIQQSVDKIARMIANFTRISEEPNYVYEDFHSFRPGHDMHYGLNGNKLRKLGWEPPFSLNDSLRNTVQWYLEHPTWLNL